MGERALSKIQWGLESVKGTAVAADTVLLSGIHPPINPDRQPVFMEDDAGVRARSVRDNVRLDSYLVSDTLTFPNAYYQILPIVYSMGIKGGISPTEQTSLQGDMSWDHTPSMTAANSPDTGTLEAGDDTQAYEAEYMMIERIQLAWTNPQDGTEAPVSLEVDYFARQWTPTTFTGAIALPSVNELNGLLFRFYQDTSWAGLGGTEKTGLLRSATIEILTGNHPKFHAGANQYFDVHGEGIFEFIATLVLEGNSDADAIYDQFQAGTKTFLQFSCSGPQIGSGVNHNAVLAAGGFWESVTPLSEDANGNNLHAAVFRGAYDITGAGLFKASVITNVSAI